MYQQSSLPLTVIETIIFGVFDIPLPHDYAKKMTTDVSRCHELEKLLVCEPAIDEHIVYKSREYKL